MPSLLKPISQKQAVITISSLRDIYWTALRGGKVTREKIKYSDGRQGITQTFVGFLELENLTLMKPFDPAKDKSVIKWCRDQVDKPTPFNVAIQPVKSDLAGTPFEGSSQILYSNCSLGDFKLPEWDRNATGLAMVEIEVIFNALPTYQ